MLLVALFRGRFCGAALLPCPQATRLPPSSLSRFLFLSKRSSGWRVGCCVSVAGCRALRVSGRVMRGPTLSKERRHAGPRDQDNSFFSRLSRSQCPNRKSPVEVFARRGLSPDRIGASRRYSPPPQEVALLNPFRFGHVFLMPEVQRDFLRRRVDSPPLFFFLSFVEGDDDASDRELPDVSPGAWAGRLAGGAARGSGRGAPPRPQAPPVPHAGATCMRCCCCLPGRGAMVVAVRGDGEGMFLVMPLGRCSCRC